MSVVKGNRKQSKIEFENLYYKVADDIDDFLCGNVRISKEVLERNKSFIRIRTEALERFSDTLIYHIKIANSIYPSCIPELNARRVAMDQAIGTCYAILTEYQRIMHRLRIPDDKHTQKILNVVRLVNALKAWRKSDNRFKKILEK